MSESLCLRGCGGNLLNEIEGRTMMIMVIGPLQVAGGGTEVDPFRPKLPSGLQGELSDFMDWGAWYYPQNPPYQYCLINVFKTRKTLPTELSKLELTLADCQAKYLDFYNSLISSKQIQVLEADPAPESWNYDSDTVGEVPSGWTVLAGTMTVQNDQYVSSPNSFKTTAYTGTHAVAKAGSSRTDLTYQSQARCYTQYGNEEINFDLLFRLTDINNYYEFVLRREGSGAENAKLRKRVGGTLTELASVAYDFADNTWYLMKADMQGQNARGFINGVQVVPASGWQAMGSDFASGVIGLRTYTVNVNNRTWFDDTYVEDYSEVAGQPYISRVQRVVGMRSWGGMK